MTLLDVDISNGQVTGRTARWSPQNGGASRRDGTMCDDLFAGLDSPYVDLSFVDENGEVWRTVAASSSDDAWFQAEHDELEFPPEPSSSSRVAKSGASGAARARSVSGSGGARRAFCTCGGLQTP